MFIVMPKEDETAFLNTTKSELLMYTHFINEEQFCDYLTDVEIRGIRPGYINQEIIKLAFWEKRVTENYMALDSDGEFIRPFYLKDFIAEDGYPYSVLAEDNELKSDPAYYKRCGWDDREKIIRDVIFKEYEFESNVMLTAHGFCIMSCKVLESLYFSFMIPHGYSYINTTVQNVYANEKHV